MWYAKPRARYSQFAREHQLLKGRHMHAPSILCPVDFSEASRSALSYAAAIGDHFGARLTVLSVDDPLLAEAAAAAGIVPSLAEETRCELQRFCSEALSHRRAGARTIDYLVTTGKPA